MRIEHVDRVVDDALHQQAETTFGLLALLRLREELCRLFSDLGLESALRFAQRSLDLVALARDLALIGVLLGDIAPLGDDEGDLAVPVFHGHERRIDDDRFLAAGATENRGLPANELALRRAADAIAQIRTGVVCRLPPGRHPERLAFHIGECDPDSVEGDLVDVKDGAFGIQKTDELDHRSQRDPRKLLPIALSRIVGSKLRVVNADQVILHGLPDQR